MIPAELAEMVLFAVHLCQQATLGESRRGMSGMRRGTDRPPKRNDRVLSPATTLRHSPTVRRNLENPEDWTSLAQRVRLRRVEVGLSTTRSLAAATGLTEKTIGKLERGQSVNVTTLLGVERVLRWGPGSACAILVGLEPYPMPSDVAAAPEPQPEPQALPVDLAAAGRQVLLSASASDLVLMRDVHAREIGEVAADLWLARAMQMIRSARMASAAELDAG